ncbi:hypothetical protein [Corynebacterium qintianiae]|uniref:hypothetical protein n=1 Tax=Corynebacterium qintianiae TaxID=2709392 RepID=UPI0013ECAE2C|nr:hypothetical protein [Corynebacterium qintianiae]
MHVFTFVIADGTVIDGPAYARAVRDLGVSAAEVNRLRVRMATITGTRRAVLEVSRGSVSLALRPLAPAPAEITVEALPVRDERSQPGHNGPDLGWQRSVLVGLPTHEGLLADASSRVVQAIFSPLLTVSEGVVTVSGHPGTTPSIALDGVLGILADHGCEIANTASGFSVRDLMLSETWVVDPIYGARLVTRWREYGALVTGRTSINRAGVPSHRAVNEMRKARAVQV